MTLADLALSADQVRALYLVHLQQMHSVEHQMLSALPSLAIHISTAEVRQRLLASAAQTPEYLTLIESIYADLAETPTGPDCKAATALVDLSMELSLTQPYGPVRDMLLIAVAREIKHLGIAKYSMAETFARTLGYLNQALALSQVRRNKVSTDRELMFFTEKLHMIPSTS